MDMRSGGASRGSRDSASGSHGDGQVQFVVGSARPYTLLVRNIATREALLTTLASLKQSRKIFGRGEANEPAVVTRRALEHELQSGDWDLVDGNFCTVTLEDWRHVVVPGGFYCLLRNGDDEMEENARTWRRRLLEAEPQRGSSGHGYGGGDIPHFMPTSQAPSSMDLPSSISALPELEEIVFDPRINQNTRRPPRAPSSTATTSSGASRSTASFNFDSVSMAGAHPAHPSPTNTDVIIITAFQGINLPCAYPPPPEKKRKCSFAPTTELWKAIRALSGGSKVNFQLFWLRVMDERNGGKRLEIKKRITASRDTTLSEMGLKHDGGGTEGYLLLMTA